MTRLWDFYHNEHFLYTCFRRIRRRGVKNVEGWKRNRRILRRKEYVGQKLRKKSKNQTTLEKERGIKNKLKKIKATKIGENHKRK